MLEGNYINIDKINCIVKKEVKSDTVVYNTKSVPKVIYKPIFYRTYDLQNISLKSGLVQNIGINLSEYMTKVEGFKISINGHEYSEFARNDVYVLFKIDTTVISTDEGEYHILDNEGEYVSSGNYNISHL